jgi:hypothetical protein
MIAQGGGLILRPQLVPSWAELCRICWCACIKTLIAGMDDVSRLLLSLAFDWKLLRTGYVVGVELTTACDFPDRLQFSDTNSRSSSWHRICHCVSLYAEWTV